MMPGDIAENSFEYITPNEIIKEKNIKHQLP